LIFASIQRQSDSSVLFNQAKVTQTAWERLRGLLAYPRLDDNQALLITPCSSVHMFGMRYPLDIAYLNKAGEVIKTVASLRPLAISMCWGASATLEMPVNALSKHNIQKGDVLTWERNE